MYTDYQIIFTDFMFNIVTLIIFKQGQNIQIYKLIINTHF